MPFCNDGRFHHTQVEADACLKHPNVSGFDAWSTASRIARRLPNGATMPAAVPHPAVILPPALVLPPTTQGPPDLPSQGASPTSVPAQTASAFDESDGTLIRRSRYRPEDIIYDHSESDDSAPPPPGSAEQGSTAHSTVSATSLITRWLRGLPPAVPKPLNNTRVQEEADRLNAINDTIPPMEQQLALAWARERSEKRGLTDKAVVPPERQGKGRGMHAAFAAGLCFLFLYWYYFYVLYEAETRHLQQALRRRGRGGL